MSNIKRIVFTVWCLALIAMAVGQLSLSEKVSAQGADKVSDIGLTEQEKRGKAFYLRGATADGEEAIAVLNDIEVPASTVTCAGCHGAAGLGKKEGGITAGNLRWTHLTKNYGHVHDDDRQHGAFSETSLVRAVTAGVDPSGNSLGVAMPRYKLKAEDLTNLIAYLKRIETDRDPGLGESSISIGTLIPSSGVQVEIGQAISDVLNAYFAEVNEGGGVYNRKIEFKVYETVPDDAFALVSGLNEGSTTALSAAVNAKSIPLVGLSTPFTQTESPNNRYLFYLHSGLEDQARALVNYAARSPEATKKNIAIINELNDSGAGMGRAVREQARKSGWGDGSINEYTTPKIDAPRLAADLKKRNIDTVFLFSSRGDEKVVLEQLAAIGHSPRIFLLGSLAAKDLVDSVPNAFAEKIFLAYPSVPSDLTEAGLGEYRALVDKYKFKVRFTTAQIGALASAKLLVESLRRAGRDVSREKLVTMLEGLYAFQTSMTPQITYGPNRRKGSTGAYMVSINPERKTFVPASDWIKAF